ncbi:MAG: hypothetical protein U0835_13620 [Isosphaeraceae bacterium]
MRAQDLQGDGAVEADGIGLVHHAHAAAAELADDPVAGDPPAASSRPPGPGPLPEPTRPWTIARPSKRGEQVVAEFRVLVGERLGSACAPFSASSR